MCETPFGHVPINKKKKSPANKKKNGQIGLTIIVNVIELNWNFSIYVMHAVSGKYRKSSSMNTVLQYEGALNETKRENIYIEKDDKNQFKLMIHKILAFSPIL